MTEQTSKPATKRPRRMAREPQPQVTSPSDDATSAPNAAGPASAILANERAPSKTSVILGLLTRAEGATLEQMVEATGWLPHTTRAAMTGLKKKGHEVTSVKADGIRTYRIEAQAPAE